jgi:hypothetical protein
MCSAPIGAWLLVSAKHKPTISVGSCGDEAASTEMVIIKDSKKKFIDSQLSQVNYCGR